MAILIQPPAFLECFVNGDSGLRAFGCRHNRELHVA
jgi:hypothetical protein